MSSEITIRKIDAGNFIEAIHLEVKPEQKRLVASNAVSIAQSKFHTFLECVGIYAGETMIGFSAFGRNPEDEEIWIARHMIGAEHQGQGLGRAGLRALEKDRVFCVPEAWLGRPSPRLVDGYRALCEIVSELRGGARARAELRQAVAV